MTGKRVRLGGRKGGSPPHFFETMVDFWGFIKGFWANKFKDNFKRN